MTGAELVFFWVLFMPVVLITIGLAVGNEVLPRVWDKLFPPKPEYVPEPILPLYEDKLEALVQNILDERPRNPRLHRDNQFRTSWNREYRRLDPIDKDNTHARVEDDEDYATIRSWDGSIIKHSTLSHPSNETCYKCERKRQL